MTTKPPVVQITLMHTPNRDPVKGLANLRAAQNLIKDENNWTTRQYARNANDDTVWVTDAKACQWCSMGALAKVNPDVFRNPFRDLSQCEIELQYLYEAAKSLGYSAVETLNDNGTHAQVMTMYSLAIENLGQVEILHQAPA